MIILTKTIKAGIVIIGAGQAGIAALDAIRENNSKFTVSIVDPDPDAFYFRAAMKFFIKNHIEETQLAGRKGSFFSDRKAQLYCTRAKHIDLNEKTLELEDGKILLYEKLLLATGGIPLLPPIQGLNLQGVVVHRSLEDTRKIIHLCDSNPQNKWVIFRNRSSRYRTGRSGCGAWDSSRNVQ